MTDLSLVPVEDLLGELGNRKVFVMALIEIEDGGDEKVEIHESDKGTFIQKAGLISCLQNDLFYQFMDDEDD